MKDFIPTFKGQSRCSRVGTRLMKTGMIVCPQPLAAEVGIQILKRGGNAVDAAVAAALVQGVIDPTNCGIGGFGQMNVCMVGKGEEKVIDFHAKAGARVERPIPQGTCWSTRTMPRRYAGLLPRDRKHSIWETSRV